MIMNITENVSLKKYNTFGIDATARYFSSFDSVDRLCELLETIDKSKSGNANLPIILGGGSNILLTQNVDGWILKNEVKGIEKINEDDDFVYVKAGAGENWHSFVLYCIENNWAGVENLSLIPGNVGASPMQNIGAYGVEIKDVFHSLQAWHIKDKSLVNFSLDDCTFGYRESVFKRKLKNQFVLTNVVYKLRKTPIYNISYGAIQQELEKMNVTDLSIQAISDAVISIRKSKLPDPKEIGNAGSFFKNPTISNELFIELHKEFPEIVSYRVDDSNIKLAAGWLIEQCGWKGYRKGDAGCHAKQALVLVNYGNAQGSEILELSTQIIDSVYSKFGIEMEREVNII